MRPELGYRVGPQAQEGASGQMGALHKALSNKTVHRAFVPFFFPFCYLLSLFVFFRSN
jgi:hypothetical protein